MLKQWLKEFVHNCICHPLLMLLPRNLACELHSRNAIWAFNIKPPKKYFWKRIEDESAYAVIEPENTIVLCIVTTVQEAILVTDHLNRCRDET